MFVTMLKSFVHFSQMLVCFSLGFAGNVSLVPARTTFSMIGKFGISGAFSVVALYTPEIFPTTLRSRLL